MRLDIASLADRPEGWDLWDQLDDFWPAFMTKDPTGGFYYGYLREHFAAHCLLAIDRETGKAVAKAHSVPLSYDAPIDEGMPEGGWDWAIRQSVHDRLTGATPVIVSALEILIRPDVRGSGLSGTMLSAMRDNVAKLGFKDLVAPVRPTGRQGQIFTPITVYAHSTRPDGLPIDPWLRVHARAGARIVNVAHQSMVISGRLAQWREWTGMPLLESGPVEVPHALVPVHVDTAQDTAVYVEPNVWMHHKI